MHSDDHREGCPHLHIFDTKQETIMKPTQTSFSLFFPHEAAFFSQFASEPCGHVLSPVELMIAPFYPDPSQRILALSYRVHGKCHVINVELLLELAKEREGQHVMWEEWIAHTIEVQLGDLLGHTWVSGCRLYCTMSSFVGGGDGVESHLRIYDFSHAGRSKHLRTLDAPGGGRGTREISPSLDGYKLPWNPDSLVAPVGGHDSIVFYPVSIRASPSTGSQLELLCEGSEHIRRNFARVEPLKVVLGIMWLKLVNTAEERTFGNRDGHALIVSPE